MGICKFLEFKSNIVAHLVDFPCESSDVASFASFDKVSDTYKETTCSSVTNVSKQSHHQSGCGFHGTQQSWIENDERRCGLVYFYPWNLHHACLASSSVDSEYTWQCIVFRVRYERSRDLRTSLRSLRFTTKNVKYSTVECMR
jgi:hypothetical protein